MATLLSVAEKLDKALRTSSVKADSLLILSVDELHTLREDAYQRFSSAFDPGIAGGKTSVFGVEIVRAAGEGVFELVERIA